MRTQRPTPKSPNRLCLRTARRRAATFLAALMLGSGLPSSLQAELYDNNYIGSLALNESRIGMWDGASSHYRSTLVLDPSAHYRLVFSGVGPRLSLTLYNLTTGGIVDQMTLNDSRWSHGFVGGFWVGEGPNVLRDVTLDNFFATGTRP